MKINLNSNFFAIYWRITTILLIIFILFKMILTYQTRILKFFSRCFYFKNLNSKNVIMHQFLSFANATIVAKTIQKQKIFDFNVHTHFVSTREIIEKKNYRIKKNTKHSKKLKSNFQKTSQIQSLYHNLTKMTIRFVDKLSS